MSKTINRDADLPRGPSWRDLLVEVARVEREQACRIRFTSSANDVQLRWASGSLHVRCEAVWGKLGKKTTTVGSAVFGGRGGYRTMPAAMLWALHEAESAVEEERAEPPLLALLAAS